MTYDPHRPLLAQLAEAARDETGELMKFNLNLVKDELWDAQRAFEDTPNGENLTRLNGHWAHGVRMLGFVEIRGGGPGKGLQEGARLAA